MSIAISASLAYDHIMNFPDSFKNHIMPDQIHILNVCFMVDKLERTWGGVAANIAYNMKMLGAEPLIISSLGKDGADYLKYFTELGLKTKYIKTDDKQLTASAYITTDADDNQITAFFNGPLDLAKDISLRDIEEEISLVMVSPTHREVMIKHLKESAELGIKTVFDPGQQITAFSEIELKKMISRAHFVIGNDYEIKLLQEKTGWNEREILKNAKVLITTQGGEGSIIATSQGETVKVKVCPVKSCDDPTGAGDAYRAGFFTGYELGYNWKTCGQMGATAAAYAVEEYGTQIKFTPEEFCQRYEQAFGEEVVLKR
ncbi:MAG: carbohydrate kinase family protein [Candidatus Magasanikbacteria bacterium CG10_big_fil_rev_8_21_14_0_10_40_10]|uniref:Carbohydrate kinase family protein n=1 Tax=Candidatus Magasanikbacteria bacterium CG10_big_fil_rev_8_21_14_0_10_40_10 TaxID=1974648 RepID=A0A2M6W3V2_9BACT|nr:MAG: carbohydrate kinase family protein [Candidatus Magasanikbacteria bacterium CG10_big_fil_rev_8_21_14_0_10_40_10]